MNNNNSNNNNNNNNKKNDNINDSNESRGLQVEKCRLCEEAREPVTHLLSGCKVLAARENTMRHNNAMNILATE